MFIQEALVHEARLKKQLVRAERHPSILHTSYLEVRLVVIRHRSEQAIAQRSDTHAGAFATTGVGKQRLAPVKQRSRLDAVAAF